MKKKRTWKKEGEQVKPSEEWFNLFLRLFVAIVLVFFAIFFTWYAVFLSSHNYYRVDGASMVPTLNSEIPASKFGDQAQGLSYDCVYVDKAVDPKLFDVIVINTHQYISDKNGKKSFKTIIKRLMATEGDYVSVAKTVDDEGNARMSFFRIPKGANKSTFQDEDAILLEEGENGYFINNPDSIWAHEKNGQPLTYAFKAKTWDSGEEIEREYDFNFFTTFLNFYNPEETYAQADGDYFVSSEGLLYVRVPDGKFFYLGDNRAFSSDAREDGFRNAEDIVGPVEIVIHNNHFFKRIGTFLTYFFKEVEKFFAR